MLKTTKMTRRRLQVVIHEKIGAPAMKKFVSTYDQILQEGEAKGEARGEAKGWAEPLLRRLTKRFGKVSTTVEKRVHKGSIQDLDRWALRVLDATSLRAVFARD